MNERVIHTSKFEVQPLYCVMKVILLKTVHFYISLSRTPKLKKTKSKLYCEAATNFFSQKIYSLMGVRIHLVAVIDENVS